MRAATPDKIAQSPALVQIEAADQALLRSLARAAEDAARRSGDWLVCRPGCTQCCLGPFAITQLDAARLRTGLEALAAVDPERARSVRERAQTYVSALRGSYPGNPVTGELTDETSLPDSMDDAPCPALNPGSGCCELYEARPVTCRTFGPASRMEDGSYGACALCYDGATDDQIAACAVEFDGEGREQALLSKLAESGVRGLTIVAYALAQP